MTATAARSSLLVAVFSIRSHIMSRLRSGLASVISSSTFTADASLPAWRETRGYRRSFSSRLAFGLRHQICGHQQVELDNP